MIYMCVHTGKALDEKLGYCPDCQAIDCAIPSAEYTSVMA